MTSGQVLGNPKVDWQPSPDVAEANALLAARVAELDAALHGHDGYVGSFFRLASGLRINYEVFSHNGVKPEAQSIGYMAPTAVDAAKAWIDVTKRLRFDAAIARGETLYWRRRPMVEYGPPVTFDEAKTSDGMSDMWSGGWKATGCFALAAGDLAERYNDPADEVRFQEARARYFAAHGKPDRVPVGDGRP